MGSSLNLSACLHFCAEILKYFQSQKKSIQERKMFISCSRAKNKLIKLNVDCWKSKFILLKVWSKASWCDWLDAIQLTLEIMMTGTSWRQKVVNFYVPLFLLSFFLFSALRFFLLRTINVWLLWCKCNIFCLLYTNFLVISILQKQLKGEVCFRENNLDRMES